jgi:hypothetical protein
MLNYSLRYASNNVVQLYAFIDLDWAGSAYEKNNTYGICFSLGFFMISLASKKQKYVALNTTKEEYIAVFYACTE